MKLEFSNISKSEFFKYYWQKKPIVLRRAFKDFDCPIDGDTLAGMSLEEDVFSRIILGDGSNFSSYNVEMGPFTIEDFNRFNKVNFSLLVQEVDAFIPEIARLKREFRIIPDWLADDVMVSYSKKGCTVGPHTDFFDVFLLQGKGVKRWEIGELLDKEPEYIDNIDLRIMKEFKIKDYYELQPGDLLYLPPMTPHNGIALGESITLSIGFRKPSIYQIFNEYFESLLSSFSDCERLKEPNIYPTSHPGRIDSSVIAEVTNVLDNLDKDDESIASCFGKLVSRPVRTENTGALSDFIQMENSSSVIDSFKKKLEFHKMLIINDAIRISYYVGEANILIFVEGESFKIEKNELERLDDLLNQRMISTSIYRNIRSISFKMLIAGFFELNYLLPID